MTKAHELFWLAHYAFNTIQPILDELNTGLEGRARAGQNITVKPGYQSIEIFVFGYSDGRCEALGSAYNVVDKKPIDMLAEKLRAKL